MLSSPDTSDPEILEWIVEFLLRQRFDNRTVTNLISVLPISSPSLFLNKVLILRRIEIEKLGNSISEKILDYFEQLIHLDSVVSDSMKCAYCAVSVECTISFLEVGRREYSSAVMRIWTDRISLMRRSGMKGLISQNLMNWKRIIESSLWDENSCEFLLKNGSDTDSAHLVDVFLEDAWSNLGPPFLERIVDSLSYSQCMNLQSVPEDQSDRFVRETSISTDCNQIQQKEVHNTEPIRQASVQNGCPFEATGLMRHGSVQNGYLIEAAASNVGMSVHHDTDIHSENRLNLSTPVVHGILNALKSNFSYLKKAVVDPLPEALYFSETLMHEMEITTAKMNAPAKAIYSDTDNHKSTSDSIHLSTNNKDKDHETEAVCPYTPVDFSENHNNRHKHVSTDLDNSPIINLSDESCNGSDRSFDVSSFRRSKRFNLPTPKVLKISPLKGKELVKCGRRKIKRWSVFEADTLRVAVRKHGIGNWKAILDQNKEIFEERNVIDLKDKWRNICKE